MLKLPVSVPKNEFMVPSVEGLIAFGMNAGPNDGSGLVRLTHTKADETTPQFSKDGHSLFFAANQNGRFAIYELGLP